MPSHRALYTQFLLLLVITAVSLVSRADNRYFAPAAPLANPLSSEPEFLPADQAFQLLASTNQDNLILRWQIADGYYLYRHRTQLYSTQNGAAKIALNFPAGKQKHDEYFGEVTAYYGGLELIVPISNTSDSPTPSLQLVYQGCADAGLCYPPQKRRVNIDSHGNVLIAKHE